MVVDDFGVSLWHNRIDPSNPFEQQEAAIRKLAAEALRVNGEPMKTALTVLSPPVQFKTNGSLYGGTLDLTKLNEYGQWLVGEIGKYRSAGLDIYAFAFGHEPEWGYDNWVSCQYTPAQFIRFPRRRRPPL